MKEGYLSQENIEVAIRLLTQYLSTADREKFQKVVADSHSQERMILNAKTFAEQDAKRGNQKNLEVDQTILQDAINQDETDLASLQALGASIARQAKKAAKRLWLCIQPFSPDTPSAEEILGLEKFQKFLEMANGFPRVMDFVKKYNINLAFGTELSFTPDQNRWQANSLMKFSDWMSNFEILRMATSVNAELYTLSGERHPYKRGPLGVIKEGAYADL